MPPTTPPKDGSHKESGTPSTSTPPKKKSQDTLGTVTIRTIEDNPKYTDEIHDQDLDNELCPQAVQDKGYKIGEKLGEGAFSQVYFASKKEKDGPEKRLAVKLIRFDKVPEEWKESRLKEELKITKKLDHRHIVKVHEVIKTRRRAFIFMDLARGSIEDQLKKHPNGFPERIARVWFLQLVEAITFLHSKGVAHRDLKTENILLDDDNKIKVTDFGFACFCFDRATKKEKLATTTCGTKAYQAPETYSPPYDARISDIWSIGVILFEMVTNRLPYPDRIGPNAEDVPDKIFQKWMQKKQYKFDDKSPVTPKARELVGKLLEPDPQKRLPGEEIFKQPWCTTK